MGYTFWGSGNGKYCLVEKDGRISLMREDSIVWENSVKDIGMTNAEVSNSGSVLLHGDGLCYFVKAGDSRIQPMSDLPYNMIFPLRGKFVRMSEDGSRIAYVKYEAKKGLSLFRFGKSSQGGPDRTNIEYELVIDYLDTKRQRSVYKVMTQAYLSEYLSWDISPDFCHVMIALPKQNGQSVDLSIYNLDLNNITDKMKKVSIKDFKIVNSMVHRTGTVMAHVAQRHVEELVILTKSLELSNMSLSPGERCFYLARGFVVLESKGPSGERVFTIKDFHGKKLSSYSMDTFFKNGIDFEILFDEKDFLNIVYFIDGKFYSYPADVLTLTTEIRRVEILLKTESSKRVSSSEGISYFVDYFDTPPIDDISEGESVYQDSSEKKEPHVAPEPQERPGEFMRGRGSVQSVRQAPKNLRLGSPIKGIALEQGEESRQASPRQDRQSILGFDVGGAKSAGDDGQKGGGISLDFSGSSVKSKKSAPQILSLGETGSSKDPDSYGFVQSPLGLQQSQQGFRQQPQQGFQQPQQGFQQPQQPQTRDSGQASSAAEIRRLEKLIESTEDRYLLGELNEDSYKELKTKYTRQLNAIRAK